MKEKQVVKALVMSDLHLEFEKAANLNWLESLAPLPDSALYDVIILAGDIAFAGMRLEAYEQLFYYFEQLNTLGKPIIFVPGNHEFYHSDNFDNLCEKLNEKLNEKLAEKINTPKYSNIQILSRSNFTFRGFTFIGATLWTDFDKKNKEAMDKAINLRWNEHEQQEEVNGMAEYKYVGSSDGYLITPEDVYNEHNEDLAYIQKQLEENNPKKCVVITHHSPSNNKLGLQWNKTLPYAYSSDLDEEILNYQPIAWIHGHIHDSLDYHIGNTRIICNPRGYLTKKMNADFNPNLIVEFS